MAIADGPGKWISQCRLGTMPFTSEAMRAIFRILAAILLALALVLLVADGTAMLAASGVVVTPLAATISGLFPGSLEATEIALQQNGQSFVWDLARTTILSWPGWAVAGGLGLLMAILGRTRSPRQLMTIDQF